jgi:hypothetical protein
MDDQSDYRAYVLDANDKILTRHDFTAENSEAALEVARQYVDGHDVEVWQRAHIVGRLRRNIPGAYR